MNARKFISIATTFKARAPRDLQDLAEKKIFISTRGGHSMRYVLKPLTLHVLQ